MLEVISKEPISCQGSVSSLRSQLCKEPFFEHLKRLAGWQLATRQPNEDAVENSQQSPNGQTEISVYL